MPKNLIDFVRVDFDYQDADYHLDLDLNKLEILRKITYYLRNDTTGLTSQVQKFDKHVMVLDTSWISCCLGIYVIVTVWNLLFLDESNCFIN